MNLSSTPQSRNRARDNAEVLGQAQAKVEAVWSRRGEVLDTREGQVALLVLAAAAGLVGGLVENWF